MPRLKRSSRKVRWAHLSEIDRRYHVGTPGWYKWHNSRQRKLSAWRYLHRLAPHSTVSAHGAYRGRSPSSNMTLPQMLSTARSLKR